MKKILVYLSIGVLIIIAGVSALLFTALGERPFTALFSVGAVEHIDFAKLRLTDKPNQFLMCPPDLCSIKPHADSPVFDIPADRLLPRWRDVLAAQSRTETMAEDKDSQQFDYVQRTARFRFPDLIQCG